MIQYILFVLLIIVFGSILYFSTREEHVYETLIVGAGPAGLAAAVSLKTRGKEFLLIEGGKSVHERDRYDKTDLICGIGGAGLFSDGKFSFYPSSTHLWNLSNKEILSESYDWFCNLLSQCGLKMVPSCPVVVNTHYETNKWFLKEYPSLYLSLDERYSLSDKLFSLIGWNNILLETTVIGYIKNKNGTYSIKISRNGNNTSIHCKNLIIAGGRFWPLFNNFQTPQFMRLEYGVRIQDLPSRSFFTHTELNDPKYKYLDKEVEFRTFCCCRNGEVVITDNNKIETYSGRSDCLPTKLSNTGFNVRILDEDICNKIISEGLFKTKTYGDIPIKIAIETDILEKYYGKTACHYLTVGLRLLLEKFPDLENANLFGPTIEGVGYYPLSDENMKDLNENIWYCGDCGGKFRGITAAMVSGCYVGKMIP